MASSFLLKKSSRRRRGGISGRPARHKEPLERRIPNPFSQSLLSIQKGDTLWTVSKKAGTPLNVLIIPTSVLSMAG